MDTDDEVKKTLLAIYQRNGGSIQPEWVVQAARNPRSPLHSHFEWDDAEAAHQHRLDQARRLIRSVRYTMETKEYTYTVPMFVRDPSKAGNEPGYLSIPHLQSDAELRHAAMVAEFQRAEAALNRAVTIAAALGGGAETQEVADRVRNLLRWAATVEPAMALA